MNESFHSLIIRTQARHQQLCREAFQKLDLSDGQPKILMRLRAQGELLQKDLSSQCAVMPATMTSLLQNMVSKGLVEKTETRVSGGKRGYMISLTEKGREQADKVAKIIAEVEDICYEGFSDKERKRLLEYLGRVEENLLRELSKPESH